MIYIILLVGGILAGFINTLAGGGSIITLPIMILLGGIPSTTANATNRVAILIQNLSGTYHFNKHQEIPIRAKWYIVPMSIIGAIIGTIYATKISSAVFDKVLAVVLIIIVVMMMLPKKKKKEHKPIPIIVECLIFLCIGLYGGFVQTGIGLVLLATLNLIEEYDLITSNAMKVAIVLSYTIFAVIIFSISGKIIWKYGLILAIGNSLGAYLGVKSAIKNGEKIIKIVLVVAVIIASSKLLGLLDIIKG